jgi:hypothetical protein
VLVKEQLAAHRLSKDLFSGCACAHASATGPSVLVWGDGGFDMKRVTVKQCTACQTLLSGDVSAAYVILDIFEFQRQGRTRALPFT